MTRHRDATEMPTVIEQAERHPVAARELAAARLAMGIHWAMNEALRCRGWQAKELAAELGIGESAVSQVLNSDGNLRVATIGRYLRALGYQPRLVLDPVESGLRPIDRPAVRARRRAARTSGDSMPVTPESGWQLMTTADGGVWSIEANIAEAAPERVVVRTECTLLTSRRADRSSMLVSAEPVTT